MNARLRSFVALAAIALCTLGATTACSGGKKKVAQTVAPTSAAAATAKPNPAPAVKPKPAPKSVNPLTGGTPTKGPVIAVKIDDTSPGRPQRNIDRANIVYVEEVEAGLDRLIAIYDTSKPVVGYVRSIRLSDPELLLQYGKITLAASGGSRPSLRTLKSSKLPSWINDMHAPYFVRAPHPGDHGYINLTLDLAKVSKKIKTAGARNVGFLWNAKPAGLAALPRANRLTTRVGVQVIQFVYDAKTQRYIRVIGGVKQKAGRRQVHQHAERDRRAVQDHQYALPRRQPQPAAVHALHRQRCAPTVPQRPRVRRNVVARVAQRADDPARQQGPPAHPDARRGVGRPHPAEDPGFHLVGQHGRATSRPTG